MTPPMIKLVQLSIYDPLLRRGAGAFIVGATGRSYLRSLLPLWLTMLSYFSTLSVILGVRRAFCLLQLWRVGLTHVRSVVQSLAPPRLCQVSFAVSGWPRWRSSHPRTWGCDS
ncbi:hypothetical protein BHM03_00034665 [Ensete ventricosum]|nr:hypothetical protein BHM03_00034665 [Ensete ventricosum]